MLGVFAIDLIFVVIPDYGALGAIGDPEFSAIINYYGPINGLFFFFFAMLWTIGDFLLVIAMDHCLFFGRGDLIFLKG